MKIVETLEETQGLVRQNAKRRVLVPTMGGLHRGHMELMRVAREAAGTDGEVAVSIFVNQLQFEPGADYERYPRPMEADEKLCEEAGIDLLFRPAPNEMYFPDRSVVVEEMALSQTLEGKSRPGHFSGVCTVVAKLFNLLAPDAAIFGEKDFQQLAIIRRLVRDLNFPIEIIGVPTVREADGLACSSRNQYLNEEERKQAPIARMALLMGRAKFQLGEEDAAAVVRQVREEIEAAPLARVDYVEAVNAETLRPVERLSVNTLLAVAVFSGKTRLIDNIRLL
ncbi:MAG: pantoate--beta-alanine ligase [Verrucomicrobiota bacterium]|nr:pantoate--beta-alanine ligase [Verrucomicrobiota bacterium]